MTREALAERLRERLQKFHMDSCYPKASDGELQWAVNDILALIDSHSHMDANRQSTEV